MTVRKFEYLVALAREGHYARAAAACHVSQPTLSTALRQLENEMGATIVKRGQRYSGLTAQGERVLAFARRMLSEFSNLRQELESGSSESVGTLRVGVIPSAIPTASAQIAPFHKQHPNVNVKLMELNASAIQRAFEDFAIDVALTYVSKDMRKNQRAHALYTEQYCLLVHSSSPLAAQGLITWEEVLPLPLCLLEQEMLSAPLRELLTSDSRGASHFETNSVSALCSQVRTGTWGAILPQSLAKDLPTAGDIVRIALPPLPGAAKVGVIIPDREFAVPLAEAFFSSTAKQPHGTTPRLVAKVASPQAPLAVGIDPRTLSGWRPTDRPIRTSN